MTTAPTCGNCTAPLTDQAHLCHPCTAKLAGDLRSVPDLLLDLEVTTTRQARISAPAKGNGDKPLPIDMRSSDAATQIRTVLHGWARCLLEEGDYGDSGWAAAGQDAALWLELELAQVRCQEWAPELVRELRNARENAERAIDRPEQRLYAGPCGNPDSDPACQATLWAGLEATEVTCRTCGHVWDVEQRRDQLIAAAGDHWLEVGAVASLVSLMSRERITTAVVTALHAGGHLQQVVARAPMYRVGEVLGALKYRHDHAPATATEVVAWLRDVYDITVTRAAVLKWGQRNPEVQRYDDGRYVRLTVLAVAQQRDRAQQVETAA